MPCAQVSALEETTKKMREAEGAKVIGFGDRAESTLGAVTEADEPHQWPTPWEGRSVDEDLEAAEAAAAVAAAAAEAAEAKTRGFKGPEEPEHKAKAAGLWGIFEEQLQARSPPSAPPKGPRQDQGSSSE